MGIVLWDVTSFIGSKLYNEISSGEFHDVWLKKLEKNNFIDNNTKQKVPDETIKLLKVQKTQKQLRKIY